MNKEIEEMARYIHGNFITHDTRFTEDCRAIAQDLYAADYRKQEWIPVSERMPDPNEYDWVLVSYTFNEDGTYGVPNVAELRKDGKWWDFGSEFSLEEKYCTVTHWMPIPDLQKGEEK